MRNIVVVPYDESWPYEYAKIKNEILPAVEDAIIIIEHVGSTSVKGLYAKPIIDINIVIENRDILPDIIQRLAQIAYTHEGDLGITGREAFKYKDKAHLMKHHLYVCAEDCAEHKRQVAFRNYLRNNPADCEAYSNIKIKMAKKYPHDIDSYIKGKEPVIMDIYRKCGIEPWR